MKVALAFAYLEGEVAGERVRGGRESNTPHRVGNWNWFQSIMCALYLHISASLRCFDECTRKSFQTWKKGNKKCRKAEKERERSIKKEEGIEGGRCIIKVMQHSVFVLFFMLFPLKTKRYKGFGKIYKNCLRSVPSCGFFQ